MFEKYKKIINEFNKKVDILDDRIKKFEYDDVTTTKELTKNEKVITKTNTKELDKNTIMFLKNTKKYTEYKRLIDNNFNTNDALWAVYNEIKTECEIKNDLGWLHPVLYRMSKLLYKENKNGLQYILASYYLDCYIRDEIYYSGCLGVGKKKDIRKMIKKENVDLTYEYFKNSINLLIPQYYNENAIAKIFIYLQDNLYKEF